MFICSAAMAPVAVSAEDASVLRAVPVAAMSEGGLFFPGDEDGRVLTAPLLETEIEADVSGMVARYRLRHTFRNSGSDWTEAIYTFPLPTDAAVDRLTMRVGARTIDGVIKEREEAKATYESARDEGRRASLVDQQRPNIFTTTVANIAPGEAIVIEIGFQESIPFRDGRFEMRMPLVIGPRYIPGSTLRSGIDETGWATGTDQVPDAGLITPPVLAADTGPGNPVIMNIRLFPGFPIATVI
ncbi:MAG: VIT domain-containing protein, partial [Proteobacteria bacterium]|nr:VIT domain-containing protein [Pseudomonadota bacterium]